MPHIARVSLFLLLTMIISSTHFFHTNGNILDLYPDNSTGKSIIKEIIPETKYAQNIVFIKRISEYLICYGFVFSLTGNERVGFYVCTNGFIPDVQRIFQTFTNAIKIVLKDKESITPQTQQSSQTIKAILGRLTQEFNKLPYIAAFKSGVRDFRYDTKEKEYANFRIKENDLSQSVESGKYVIIIGSHIDYHPVVDIADRQPLYGTQKNDNPKPIDVTEANGKNINCTAYIFLNVNGSYWQHPLDYTKNIFHKAATISQRDCSLIIKRDSNMAYYVYLYDKNGTDNYKGLCVAVNGIMFQEITQIFQSFKKASDELLNKVSPSKILKQLIQEFSNFKYTKLPAIKYSIENDHINKFNYTDIISNKNKLSLQYNGYTIIAPEKKPSQQSAATTQDENEKSGCLSTLLWWTWRISGWITIAFLIAVAILWLIRLFSYLLYVFS